MRFEDIHVGDVVRIRDWDDMAEEFNVSEFGGDESYIETKPIFLEEMRYLCGREVKVVQTRSPQDIIVDYEPAEAWFLGADMFEPAQQLTLEPFDNDDMRMLLEI